MKFYRPTTLRLLASNQKTRYVETKYQGIIKHRYTFFFLTDNDMHNFTIHATLYLRDELMHYNINKIKAR